ncbi:LysR family transcriptional regulator [Burkholderia glumae]|nr:LysR family transcriptional regulator [Burkholderia glumae]
MAAAHHRSPHAAARALGVTQPAITPTIGEVEHALPRAAQQLRATMRDALAQPGNGAPAIAAPPLCPHSTASSRRCRCCPPGS